MNRSTLRRLISSDFENLLDALTTRQHLRPHDTVQAALASTVQQLGVCPNAIEHALQWLQLDGSQPIGRLRRTELMQLARSVHRFWRPRAGSNATPAAKSPQS
jgi:hypothetical protein